MAAIDTQLKNYNHYSAYLRERYNGQKVYKVIVDGGFTCPNRDGSKGFGGCTYCNVDSFTPELSRSTPSLREQVLRGIERARKSYGAEKFIIYFQPNTNTYAPAHYLKMMYDEAISVDPGNTVGLSVGTRPDCIDREKAALLESYTDRLDVDIEMGMESIYNDTLAKINRGCSHEDLETALLLFKDSPVNVCVHTIFGFPWETRAMMLRYAEALNAHPWIRFVKLHHLHIVEGSVMGVKFKREPFPLFSLEEYADFLCEFIPRLNSGVIIQRLFGLSDYKLLIAPNWQLKKSEIQSFIDKELQKRAVFQGELV